MATEIERKFLVASPAWRDKADAGSALRQAYLAKGPASVRVRIVDETSAKLTVKAGESGVARSEFEYEIPLEDACALFELATGGAIEKRRHRVPAGEGLVWEIDVFAGANEGLVLAELELPDPDTPFARPEWLGEEVTGDPRYYNSALASGGSRSPD
ncbi:adenylate cyclase [Novosphingobium sp. PC22D]|uniref:CYTH domain-containing protein n=1 Tax=Novosphingobium sp. PC22D TaxID=1962403 RepID=UPI000BF1D156|nr:CYTH domain-containing protein [Novosphingobium sp. PC22D]PEQ14195.1 adenylate cyclase [Novosphingobium sp. PC22D]